MTLLQEAQTVSRIAKRAKELVFCGTRDMMDIIMDIDAAHGDVGLRLKELLAANDSDFGHDIGGIYQNLNRETLTLENCFLPRYAIHQ